MAKLGLGTIGTSWITDSFIEAALATNSYVLKGIYSRSEEKGKKFVEKYGDIPVETDLSVFMANPAFAVIYIASPNSLHYEQALMALKAGKHVLVEKPASTNVTEWDEMVQVARENDVLVMEAAKHMFVPNLDKIKAEIQKIGRVVGSTFPYIRYSSRYDNVLAGEEPNIFSLQFAGGALMDLGIYPVYTAVALFGEPEEAVYYPRKIQTGVDGIGTVILRYKEFDVTILVGKIATSFYEVEIYGLEETLIIDHVSGLNKARRVDNQTAETKAVSLAEQHENSMFYEAEAFAQMIKTKNNPETLKRYEELTQLARIVSGLLNDMLTQSGIVFDLKR